MPIESRLLAGPVPASLLVVDDEPQVRTVLKDALGESGFSVDVAADGESAILKARTTPYDIAICDLKMPGIDGLETISRIRQINPDIQFIILTAHGTLESAIESLRMGAFDFLQKPVVLKDLEFSIGRALERRDLLERSALFDLSRTIFSTLDPDELYGRLVQSAMEILRADDASLMLLGENRELYIARSTSSVVDTLTATRLALGERVAGRVAQQAEPALINDDVAGDGRFGGVTSLRRIRAAIVCPLTMRGELLGVLNVNRLSQEMPYTERDRQTAVIVSSLVALALGNARLHKELQTRLQQISDTQEEVIQNEKMVALGSLLSGVAHELNNPLCAVLGYGQLLQQGDLDSKMRKGVEVIVREGERAARIVADLLRFARRERPEKRLLGLSGVLLRTLERKSYDLKSSRIEVETDLDPELPLVLGDFHQLSVAFTNLITNAQQAMFEHRGRGVLRIAGGQKGGKVVLTFTDDGPGIQPEHARRVFDPFFTTKAVGQGAGLGLSVCFAIVRDHGGTLRAVGKPGRGAVFTVELPAAPAEALVGEQAKKALAGRGPDTKTIAARSRKKGEGVRRPSGPRVLIAEPEADVQSVVLELLERLGYRVDTADNGETALAKIRGQEYEAVIADFDLPQLEGRMLLDAVQAARPRLARRVIFLASDTTRPNLIELTSTSGTLLLGKPFRLDALRDAMRRLFPDSKDDVRPVRSTGTSA
jgi:signal transduction histidine kinase/DNA-binding response OmpR family regulator